MRREDLLGHYERELLYLRRAGEGFSRAYPKIAGRLALGPEQAGDPHVERLIESFAFLTARLQLNLDREFPRFTDALLGILYPHLTAPIPSCAIARFSVDPDKGPLTDGYRIRRGTPVHAMAGEDLRCRFTTCSDVDLWPVALEGTSIQGADAYAFTDGLVSSVLRIDLAALGTPFEALSLRRLRVFIDAEPTVAAALYESMTCDVVEAIYEGEDGQAFHLRPGASAVSPAGLEPEDSLFPYPANGHPAYRLLQEYFAFPQKFLFLDLAIPEGALRGGRGRILLGLRKPPPARLAIRPDTLVMGCAPVVNLFNRAAEPIRLDQRKTAYLVLPDALRDRITEVYQVRSVAGIRDDGRRVPYVPLFSTEHAAAGDAQDAFWYASREPTHRDDRVGTDTWISLVDLNFDPAQPAAETLLVQTLCTNRGLAEEVPAKAVLSMEDAAPIANVRLLYKPSLPRYRGAAGETAWRLVSQMSLNHLSLTGGQDSLRALQEILTLHALEDPASRVQVAALRALETRPAVHRVGQDAWRGFCRGLEVTLEVDERGFVGASPLVFGEVLARFLGLYAGINSFVQLRFRSMQRGGTWKTWSRIAGSQHVL
ncbi:type VI secretion system baseplate subunit TssF [Arenibaculum pallidiluteum]|uniref:type VI secretion system baseplate subunit TssF n=1 Tax=Arenibaculum pallidiluteum TaxID=2812559 RepID=UPI001A971C7B|nr:type VI secretion system baseplate subunit TssF [Arenibaculum pallidiluteum]